VERAEKAVKIGAKESAAKYRAKEALQSNLGGFFIAVQMYGMPRFAPYAPFA
jgi:hypothetical protein